MPIVVLSTGRALELSDAGKVLRIASSSSQDITVPKETDVAFPDGTIVNVRQAGTGQVTIVEDDEVTVTTPSTYDLVGQWAEVSLHKVSGDLWDMVGALAEDEGEGE